MTIKYAHMNYLLLFVSMSYLSNHILCRATEKHMQNRPKKKDYSVKSSCNCHEHNSHAYKHYIDFKATGK